MIVIPNVYDSVALVLSDEQATSSDVDSKNAENAYTFADTKEQQETGYYTPWDTAPMDSGMGYLKVVLGAVGLVAVFCFAVPYVVGLIVDLFHGFKNNFR